MGPAAPAGLIGAGYFRFRFLRSVRLVGVIPAAPKFGVKVVPKETETLPFLLSFFAFLPVALMVS